LKEKIRFEGERKIMLNLLVLLYNFRASKVGQNQIRNVYIKMHWTTLGRLHNLHLCINYIY
jgi:hypothetical protein